ncbi:hypothetical protein ACFFIS_14785 [Virgibacillus soli]|uniref:Uncharacterized protein n=1 Tax=Paracerasibacillus soli TaxID=480284 RepID=A0ABU5CVB4_9BACI|nr:hypothetical protein [Virgibacillus soli]MDY0409752.1 hypothetical protein [Virgibacillus soli]
MRCGAKCFIVNLELRDRKKTTSVIVRSPAEARKSIRKKYGSDVEILSVIEKRQ